jgi:hypothetical protein
MSSSSSTAPSVSLQFSLVDNPRTQIEEWYEAVMAKARGLCIQWDPTGAITLVSDTVWNAVPGNLANPAQVLAGSHPPAYRPRPDYDPPAALDPAATAVELANWKLEMDMHFAYTLAQNTLALALMASVGPVNKTLLKVEYTPTPLHFLTPRQIIDCMFKKHASLNEPDLKKLRAPLFEPLQAVAELEVHMGKFVLAFLKLTATGHGGDSYRYFELFLETIIKGFPLISTNLDGFYQRHPTVPQQTITTLFGYLKPMVSHLIEQSGSAPFSGGAITPKAQTPNTNRRKKAKGKPKGQWGSWTNAGAAAHLSEGVFQAQTPLTFLDTDREAEYLATIDRLQARLNISDAQHAFSMQHVYAAQQNGSSESRPRSHYCGLYGWNNDHNGTQCCGMARDKRFTPAMRAATTHVGTGGNPKVAVPVGFVRPSPFAASPFWPDAICLTLPSETCLTCSSPPCLSLLASQVSSATTPPRGPWPPWEIFCLF